MRKPLTIAAIAIGCSAALIVAIAAQAASSSNPTKSGHFTVVEHAITDTVVDTGPKGDSLGDLLAFGNPIFNASNTVKIGNDQGSCIRTKVGAAWECSWTTILKGGSIVVEGPFYDTSDSVLAITGGTGIWSKSRGHMLLHARDKKGSSYNFTFDVSQ